MTAATLPVTRREAILAHLAGHPDLTASELARVIGSGQYLGHLLADMAFKGQVVFRTGYRPGQSREVHLWSVAPPGTVPPPRPPVPAAVLAHNRERDRRTTAARRARGREPFAGAMALPGAACRGADPDLFFPDRGDAAAAAAAVAICTGCPVRAACYARAVRNGERSGIWGGVNLEDAPRRRAAAAGECQPAEGPSQP